MLFYDDDEMGELYIIDEGSLHTYAEFLTDEQKNVVPTYNTQAYVPGPHGDNIDWCYHITQRSLIAGKKTPRNWHKKFTSRNHILPVINEMISVANGESIVTNPNNVSKTNTKMDKSKARIKPCEGYIAKLQPRVAKRLRKFRNDLYVVLIQLKLLYWDDTVAMADKKRICLRFYGNEFIAFYVAHDQKNMKGILEDGILEALTADTKVMHDHNSINYNKRFIFINIECNAHIQRDLQKIIDDAGHTEPKELKDLISISIKERNDLIDKGCNRFDDEYIKVFNEKLTDILERAKNRAIENKSIYTGPFERAVISRIIEYRENFFAWIYDFSIPTTNNLSLCEPFVYANFSADTNY